MLAANVNNFKVGDENDAAAVTKQVKKIGAGGGGGGVVANTETNKRAALSQLQNRGNLGNVTGKGITATTGTTAKETAQKEVKEAIKLQNAFRGVKARVDSHWKKPVGAPAAGVGGVVTTVTAVNDGEIKLPQTAAAAAQRKLITRSSSMRAINEKAVTNNKTTTNEVDRQAPVKAQKIQEKSKTMAVSTNTAATAATAAATAATAAAAKVQRSKDIKTESKDNNNTKPSEVKNKNVDQLKSDIKTEDVLAVQSLTIQTLNGVKDIDEDDGDKLMLVSEYAKDIYEYLFQVEQEQLIHKNYMDGQVEVHPKMRAVLIDWINEVHLQFHLIVETFQLTVAIVDRYLQVVKTTKRSHFQLVGVTALFLAAKYEELLPPAIADIIFITDDTYTEKQVRLMELDILKALDFDLSRPLPIHFLRRFSKAADADSSHHSLAKYLLELAMMEYDLAHYKPSEIAAAALYLSLNLLKSNHQIPTGLKVKYWTTTLQWYSRYTAMHLKPIAKKIAACTYNAPSAKLKAIYTKFCLAKFQKVAMLPQLYSPLMTSIVNGED